MGAICCCCGDSGGVRPVPDVVVVVVEESDGWVEGFWIGSTFIVIGYIAVEEKK
jgi:hypothetical protein